jgi:retinol dehydrogenase-12
MQIQPPQADQSLGGNGGIGYETIKVMEHFCSDGQSPNCRTQALLSKNAKVYMATRSQERAEAAITKLKSETGKEAIFLELDLSSLASARKAAEEFKS